VSVSAGIQTWTTDITPFPADSCAAIGDFSQGKCTAAPQNDNTTTLTCKYGGGDGDRAVTYVYACSSTYEVPIAEESAAAAYTLTLKGPPLCNAPPPSPPAPSDSCIKQAGGNRFNLTAFRVAMAGPAYRVVDSTERVYYFDPCGPLDAVICTGSKQAGVAGIQTWQDGPSPLPEDSCAVLGDFSTGVCSSDNMDSLTCKYTGGDGDRALLVEYTSAATITTPTVRQSGQMTYSITLSGPLR